MHWLNTQQRAIDNLLCNTDNRFEFVSLNREVVIVDDICVGVYWQCILTDKQLLGVNRYSGVGVNPAQAIDNAIGKTLLF